MNKILIWLVYVPCMSLAAIDEAELLSIEGFLEELTIHKKQQAEKCREHKEYYTRQVEPYIQHDNKEAVQELTDAFNLRQARHLQEEVISLRSVWKEVLVPLLLQPRAPLKRSSSCSHISIER